MIKVARHIVFIVVSLMLTVSCSRDKIIPDSELQKIFRDIFVSNALISDLKYNRDSTDIYTPILEKYGYTAADLKSTVNNFSKRKSARLTDVVEDVIKQIEKEYIDIKWQVERRDTIEARAKRMFAREVFYVDSIRVHSIKDTADLRMEISPIEPGSYEVSYRYKLDSGDLRMIKAVHNVVNKSGRVESYNTEWMRRGESQRITREFEYDKDGDKIVMVLGEFTKRDKHPGVDIDSLKVIHYLPMDVALDSLISVFIDYNLLVDGKEWWRATQDSVAFYTNPPRFEIRGDSVGE